MSTENNNTILTLTVELPTQLKVNPTTSGRQMEALVNIEYPCAKTLQQFLVFDIKRRCENMVRQDGASQDIYACVVQGGKLQRLGKASNVEAAKARERAKAVEALAASGITREQALKMLGYKEEDLM